MQTKLALPRRYRIQAYKCSHSIKSAVRVCSYIVRVVGYGVDG